MTNGLVEIAKLVGGLSVAVISMSVVTYALAVPRVQERLSGNIKSISVKKTELESKIKQAKLVTIKEIEEELNAIEEDRKKIQKDVASLSWKWVVGVPALASFLALGCASVPILSSSPYDPLFLGGSFVLSLSGFGHLLRSLRRIEHTVKMTAEGQTGA